MSDNHSGSAGEEKKGSLFSSLAGQKILAFATLIILILGFSLISPNFFITDNIITILLSTCVNGLLALGVTFVIITGGIDLSIGTVMTFTSVIAGVSVTQWGFPIWMGIIIGVLTGILTGFISGTLVSRLKLPAFIATLGMMKVSNGLSLVFSNATPVYFPSGYKSIATGSIVGKFISGFQMPNAVLIFFFMAIIATVILNKTVMGRYNFAIGSNAEATRLSGVNVANWTTAIYCLNGAFCGVAGIIMSSRLGSAQPALGSGYELEAIAAVVIGGTSMSGGMGTISGTVIGAFIISVLTNGLRILGVKQEWQTVVIGVVVVLAVVIDILRRRRQERV